MARITDQKKIDRLKESTMKLVVAHGFGGASVSLIANDAHVASGYFYMQHKGKYEMVNSLLQDVYQEIVGKLEEFMGQGSSFSFIIENLVRHFFHMANNDPVKLKFLYVLMHDYNFAIDKEMRDNINGLIQKMKEMGHSSGELDKMLTEDDIYLCVILNTIQFINLKYKKSSKEIIFKKKDEDHLIYLTRKLLQP
jgi:AcrR family transcriptional regulator